MEDPLKSNLEAAIADALASGIPGAQIEIWVREFLINETDFILKRNPK